MDTRALRLPEGLSIWSLKSHPGRAPSRIGGGSGSRGGLRRPACAFSEPSGTAGTAGLGRAPTAGSGSGDRQTVPSSAGERTRPGMPGGCHAPVFPRGAEATRVREAFRPWCCTVSFPAAQTWAKVPHVCLFLCRTVWGWRACVSTHAHHWATWSPPFLRGSPNPAPHSVKKKNGNSDKGSGRCCAGVVEFRSCSFPKAGSACSEEGTAELHGFRTPMNLIYMLSLL